MNYSRSDIEAMRRDALRRTREMHNKVSPVKPDVQANKSPEPSKEKAPNPSSEKIAEEYGTKKAAPQNSNPLNNLFSGLFSGEKMDSDRLMLILLIFVLAKEGADLKLLIALGYILM